MKAGWQITSLGDIADVKGGKRVPKGYKLLTDPTEHPYITVSDFSDDGTVDQSNLRYVSNEVFRQIARYTISYRDLYLSIAGTIGKTGRIPRELDGACLTENACKLVLHADVDQDFVYYFTKSEDFEAQAGTNTRTAAQPKLALERLKTINIPIASLPEQRRIVGILGEAFEGIATAKANAEKNLQNARALFESHLQSVFTERGAGWDRVSLEVLIQRGWIESHLDGNHGSDYPRKEEFISEGVPYISANCMDDDRVDMTRAKYLSPGRAALLRKGIAQDNDVLFAHNATVGPVAILHTKDAKVILGTSLTYYRCNRSHIVPEYLAHYMRSHGFKTQYLQVMRQSTRNQIPITKQREFFHVIPPISEQKAIVGQLDGLLENGQLLASIYQQKLAALDQLKKSLLHQAFSGEL